MVVISRPSPHDSCPKHKEVSKEKGPHPKVPPQNKHVTKQQGSKCKKVGILGKHGGDGKHGAEVET